MEQALARLEELIHPGIKASDSACLGSVSAEEIEGDECACARTPMPEIRILIRTCKKKNYNSIDTGKSKINNLCDYGQ